MKDSMRVLVISLVAGAGLILSGCGGGDSNDNGINDGAGGAIPAVTGGSMIPTGATPPPNTTDGVLNAAGINELNGGAAQVTPTSFSIADYVLPGIVDAFPPISGADMGGTFPHGAYLNDQQKAAVGDDGVEVTLTPGLNTIHASIKRLATTGVLYPHWADFIVPDGYVATNFCVTALSAGMSASWTTVPGFSINNNVGTPVYSYLAAHFSLGSAMPIPATEYPAPLSQLRLACLFRANHPRPYRVFVGGAEGASVELTCTVVPGTGNGGTNNTALVGTWKYIHTSDFYRKSWVIVINSDRTLSSVEDEASINIYDGTTYDVHHTALTGRWRIDGNALYVLWDVVPSRPEQLFHYSISGSGSSETVTFSIPNEHVYSTTFVRDSSP